MSQRCEICKRPRSEWDAESLEGHLRTHGRPSVEAIEQYRDRVDEIFGDGAAPADDPGGPEPPGGPAGNGGGPGGPVGGGGEAVGGAVGDPDGAYGKKWYLIGVGGAGNNIVDAVLLRRRTLQHNNEDRSQVWEGGLAGYGVLNTNIAELEQTFYAQEVKEYDRMDLESNAIIGFGKHEYAGAGYRWDIGRKLMEADFEGEGNPFRERWDMTAQDLRDAQAVMFVHSVTKGTGCGATPALARYVREEVLSDDLVVSKPMLSSVVLPSEGAEYSDFGGRAKTNGVVGLARISKAVDAIIPFDNSLLQQAQADITPRIEGIEQYNPPQYAELNKPLVAFLEAFTMSSIPQFLDQEATMAIKGDVFDVSDSFRPVEDKYPIDVEREYRPAVVLAPVLGRARGATIDRADLEILARNALFQNNLADFEPATAWGGTFLLYGPAEKMEQVSGFIEDGTFTDIVTGPEFLDAGNVSGAESVDVHVKQLVNPYLDDVYLWGTLWNPKLPSMESMYEHAQRLKEEGNTSQAEGLRDVWHLVDPLFSCLGRENMG